MDMTWNGTTVGAAATLLAMTVTAAQAQPTVYVLTQGAVGVAGPQSLVVINGATYNREAQIPLGRGTSSFWDGSLVISPDGDRVYVANTADDSVSVVSTATNTVIDTLPRELLWPGCISGCGSGTSLAVSPDGRLYVASNGLTVIDLPSRTRINRLDIISLDIVLSPDGTRLFVRTAPGANGPHNIEVYDASALATAPTKADALLATVTFPVGVDDRGAVIDISSDGRFLYAPLSHAGNNFGVAVVDATTYTFVTETATPGAYASAAASNGTTTYVTGRGNGDVLYRLSPTTHAPLGVRSGLSPARDVAFSSDGSRAYVAVGITLQVIDTATHASIRSMSFAQTAVALAVRGGFTPQTGLPGAPTNFRATASGNIVNLFWGPPTSGGAPVSYTLVARTATGGPITTIPLGPATTFSAAAPNGTYALSVTATNASGTGPESASVTLSVPAVAPPPGAPTNLAATVAGDTATFTWSAPSSGGAPNGYTLVAGLTPGFTAVIASLPLAAAPTSSAIPGVPPGTYYVRILAQNAGGTSAASNEVVLTVAGPAAPTAPTLNAPTVSGNTVSLSWSPGPGGGGSTSYQLTAFTPGGAVVATVPLSGTSASFANVPGGTYLLRLVAFNSVGPSPASNQVTVVVP
jgi:YVTN family beta-propeller protein